MPDRFHAPKNADATIRFLQPSPAAGSQTGSRIIGRFVRVNKYGTRDDSRANLDERKTRAALDCEAPFSHHSSRPPRCRSKKSRPRNSEGRPVIRPELGAGTIDAKLTQQRVKTKAPHIAAIRHDATEERRRMVKQLISRGMPRETIASIIGIKTKTKTMDRHYKVELATGADYANAQVAGKLYQQGDYRS
jgi:hypothetical protein